MKGALRPGFGGKVSRSRLRIAFIAVGTLLLGALGFLAHLASERLEEARADREHMVASRVFDEMEREVSAFLESEADRPPYSDLQATNPENWAPFVVGYFARARTDVAGSGEVVVAEGVV